jgi:hypothetical protein
MTSNPEQLPLPFPATQADLDRLKAEILAALAAKKTETCPHCGYCPHCGRSRDHYSWPWTQPYITYGTSPEIGGYKPNDYRVLCQHQDPAHTLK